MRWAAQAAVGLAVARNSDETRSALASRDIVSQAKGMIMERYNIKSGAAFVLLTKLSKETNVPVFEVARILVFAEGPPL